MEPGTEQPQAPSGWLIADSVEQMRSIISAFEASVAAQVAAGRRLGDLVRDQIADGQTETLLTLERHASALRRRAAQVEAAADRVRSETQESEAALAGAVTDASERIATLLAALDQRADAAAARVEASAQAAEQLLVASAQAAEQLLVTSAERVRARVEAVERTFEQSAARVEQSLQDRVDEELARVPVLIHELTARLVDEVGDHMHRAAAGLDDVGRSLVDGVRHELLDRLSSERQDWTQMLVEGSDRSELLASRLVDQLTDVSGRLVGGVAQAAEALEHDLRAEREQARAAADDFLAEAEALLARWERRDQRRERGTEERVETLVQRTDAAIGVFADRLAMTIQQLHERDLVQERARVEEFVRVLDDLMTRVGSRRSLRRLVTRAVEGERRERAASPAYAPPAVEPADAVPAVTTEAEPVAPAAVEAAPEEPAPSADAPRPARKSTPAAKKASRKRTAPRKTAAADGPAGPATSEETT